MGLNQTNASLSRPSNIKRDLSCEAVKQLFETSNANMDDEPEEIDMDQIDLDEK